MKNIATYILSSMFLAQLSGGAPFRVERLDPAVDDVIAQDAQIETLGDRFALTEGALWVPDASIAAPERGYLLFSENAGNVIYRWQRGRPLSVFLEKSGFTGTDNSKVGAQTVAGHVAIVLIGSNGLALDPQQRVVVTAMNDGTVYRLEKNGTRTILADKYDGKRFSGPNDIVVKSNGSIYFTDTPWGLRGAEKDPNREIPFYGFYLIKDGKVTLLGSDKDAHGGIPNGITLSPDEKYLYVTSGGGKTMRYEIKDDDTIANGRLFVNHGSDGLRVDTKGNLYSSSGGTPGIIQITSPEGKPIGRLHLPQPDGEPKARVCATNLAFGDADDKGLYITACTHVFKLRMKIAGVRPGQPRLAAAQAPGEQIFNTRCAMCHNGQQDSRAPSPDALKARTPQAVIEALVNGGMRVQGSQMNGADRRAVAEFVTGKRIDEDVTGAATGRCAKPVALGDVTRGARWTGWGPAPTNARFQSADAAALRAADLSRLTLKWAFGFPDASSAWAQPTVAGGRVFVGSQNGTVYALDAATGCIDWTFSAGGGVRTAITIARTAGRTVAYFGDTAANAYALDAATGKQIWIRKVDDHPLARVTGSPALFEDRLYVPVSSYEESQGADPQYACCTFRGNVNALDAKTGAVIWKTYMVADTPAPRGKSSAGVQLWGPSGSAIWSPPTVDAKRRMLYVATGNTYSGPPQPSSDAVVALDIRTGAIKWMKQATPSDIYVTGCGRSANPNCPETNGPDVDFGSPPILATTAGGRDLIVIGQKSGVGWAFDPDKNGEVVWQYRAGEGGALGGIEWGSAVDGTRAYFAVSDITRPKPGGLHAVSLATGERVWVAAPPAPKCGSGRGCNAAQSAALTAIPGAIFSGSNDGALRAFSTADGAVIWEFDSNREFTTVNGVKARGASMIGPGPAIAGGMVFVNSGYGAFGGRTGNVLLAFGVN